MDINKARSKIVNVLVSRDSMSQSDAEKYVKDFECRVKSGAVNPFTEGEEFLDEFDLEQDYLEALLYN
jgi:hypothetical protein